MISVHHEDLDFAVDPITGWRFYKRSRRNVQTTPSGSRTNLQTASSSSCCEHGALLEGEPLRNTRFAEADLRVASTGREVAHRLAYPPRGRGVTAVPRPAPLTRQGAPQDPRQDLTSGRVESGQKRGGTADGICGPG